MDFIDFCKSIGMDERTGENYECRVRTLERILGKQPSDITVEDVNNLPRATRTKQNYKTALRAYKRWLSARQKH